MRADHLGHRAGRRDLHDDVPRGRRRRRHAQGGARAAPPRRRLHQADGDRRALGPRRGPRAGPDDARPSSRRSSTRRTGSASGWPPTSRASRAPVSRSAQGVDTIEHGLSLHREPALLDAMAERGIVLVPTLSTFHDLAERFTDDFAPALVEQAKRQLDEAYATLVAARAAGVTLAMGHDSGPPGDERDRAGAHGRWRAVGARGRSRRHARVGAGARPVPTSARSPPARSPTCSWSTAIRSRTSGAVRPGADLDGRPGRKGRRRPIPRAAARPPRHERRDARRRPRVLAAVRRRRAGRARRPPRRGPALLLFVSEECPTCVLTLRRLAPLVPELAAAGVRGGRGLRGSARGGRPRRAPHRLRRHGPVRAGAVRGLARVRAGEPADRGPRRSVGARDRARGRLGCRRPPGAPVRVR